MAKGVFRGFVTGVVISGVGVGALSLLNGLPDSPPPEAAAVDVPAGSDFEKEREDREPVLPGKDDAPRMGDAPRIDTPETKAGDPVAAGSTEPAAKPETGGPETTLTPPTEAEPSIPREDTDPVTQEPAAPTPPQEEDGRISSDPAQPNPPSPPEQTPFPEQDEVDSTPSAEQDEPPALADRETPLPSVTDESPEKTRPGIGNPAGTLTERDAPAATPDPQTPPIVANAAPFDNPQDKPLMSIILLDDSNDTIGLDALASFPYALTFAVDPLLPDAADRMARYREAGFEVMAMVNMPAAATASDTETLMRGALSRLPGIVAVVEGDETGLQTDKAVSDQVSAILAETGHGLVLFPKGLNTARKLASKAGVPAATVFRDFDAKDQNAQVIRRFLDQAAFKARQEEDGVIMLGRLRPETISALLLWGLQDRADTVALAPISALLLAGGA